MGLPKTQFKQVATQLEEWRQAKRNLAVTIMGPYFNIGFLGQLVKREQVAGLMSFLFLSHDNLIQTTIFPQMYDRVEFDRFDGHTHLCLVKRLSGKKTGSLLLMDVGEGDLLDGLKGLPMIVSRKIH